LKLLSFEYRNYKVLKTFSYFQVTLKDDKGIQQNVFYFWEPKSIRLTNLCQNKSFKVPIIILKNNTEVRYYIAFLKLSVIYLLLRSRVYPFFIVYSSCEFNISINFGSQAVRHVFVPGE